jgi:hypothetical protein
MKSKLFLAILSRNFIIDFYILLCIAYYHKIQFCHVDIRVLPHQP